MTDESPPTVDFRCCSEAESDATPPKSAYHTFPGLRETGLVNDAATDSSNNDPQTRDALKHGWYIYPPTPIAIWPTDTTDAETDTELSVRSGAEYVTPTEDNLPDAVTASIDTLWHVRVPDGYVLLITAPLYNPDHPTRPQLLTADDGWVKLQVPVTVSESWTFHDIEPIAQAMVLSEELLPVPDYAAGTFDDDGEKRYVQANHLAKVYDDPYEQRIRARKSPAEVRRIEPE